MLENRLLSGGMARFDRSPAEEELYSFSFSLLVCRHKTITGIF